MPADLLDASIPQHLSMNRRVERVSDLLRAELGALILSDLHDPRIRLATVSTVDMTKDLRRAKVRVSVLGNDDERQLCIAALQHACGFLRTRLASRLRLRFTPELLFELDRGAEHAERITTLLESSDEYGDP